MTSHVGLPNASHMGVASGTPTYGTYGTDGESGYERANLMSGDARESNGFVYIVHWPEARFTKVGCAVDGRRWRPFLKRGGELLGVIEPGRCSGIVEWEFHVALGIAGLPRRFATKPEAAPYLGRSGAGWTECYVDLTGRDVTRALLTEYARRRRS